MGETVAEREEVLECLTGIIRDTSGEVKTSERLKAMEMLMKFKGEDTEGEEESVSESAVRELAEFMKSCVKNG